MEDTGLRDALALERTRLANERTLLAYIRTALALVAGGVALLQLFPTRNLMVVASWGLIMAGVLSLAIGVRRFSRVQHRLNAKPPKA